MRGVFPYQTLFGAVDLEILSVAVDGRDLPYKQISQVEHTVALHQAGRPEWDVATIRVRANLPAQEVDEGPWNDLVCLAVLTESATNARTTERLSRGQDGGWYGAIDLAHVRHAGRARLALALVGEVEGVKGRVIGTTEKAWYVDLKEVTPRRQREIKIKQVDFREGPEEWLRPFRDSLWIIETVGDVPTVYLNTAAVEGLIEVLNDRGGSEAERVLRNLTASQVAQDAWTAMFHTAISELDLDDDGTPVMPNGWREPVLRMMLPDVLPGRQLADALFEINDRRTTSSGWPELQTSIQFAAGKRSQVTKKLTSAVRSVHDAERSGTR